MGEQRAEVDETRELIQALIQSTIAGLEAQLAILGDVMGRLGKATAVLGARLDADVEHDVAAVGAVARDVLAGHVDGVAGARAGLAAAEDASDLLAAFGGAPPPGYVEAAALTYLARGTQGVRMRRVGLLNAAALTRILLERGPLGLADLARASRRPVGSITKPASLGVRLGWLTRDEAPRGAWRVAGDARARGVVPRIEPTSRQAVAVDARTAREARLQKAAGRAMQFLALSDHSADSLASKLALTVVEAFAVLHRLEVEGKARPVAGKPGQWSTTFRKIAEPAAAAETSQYQQVGAAIEYTSRALELLKAGPRTVSQIAKALDLSDVETADILHRLRPRFPIVRAANGVWSYAGPEAVGQVVWSGGSGLSSYNGASALKGGR